MAKALGNSYSPTLHATAPPLDPTASEGVWAKAGKRRSRLEDAVSSTRETLVALRLAGGGIGYPEQAPLLWSGGALGERQYRR